MNLYCRLFIILLILILVIGIVPVTINAGELKNHYDKHTTPIVWASLDNIVPTNYFLYSIGWNNLPAYGVMVEIWDTDHNILAHAKMWPLYKDTGIYTKKLLPFWNYNQGFGGYALKSYTDMHHISQGSHYILYAYILDINNQKIGETSVEYVYNG